MTLIANAEPTQLRMRESAADSPINVKNYTQETNIFKLAAPLSDKIIRNHAFTDGNKRAALVAADMFLKINGYKLETTPLGRDLHSQGLAAAHLAVTTGKWDVDKLSQYYEQISTPEIMAYRNQASEY